MRTSGNSPHSSPHPSGPASPLHGFTRLTVALACADGDWPHTGWPAADDPYVGRAIQLERPFLVPAGADVVVLRCDEPLDALAELGGAGAPVIVVSPHRDTETVVEVFRRGAGYLVEGDHCTCMLSSAVVGATVGHTYLSPSACAAVRDGVRRAPEQGDSADGLRALLSPREREVMELLSTGLGAQEIALRLSLSEKTIRNNLSNIYAKLHARGSTDAVLRWLGAAPVVRT
ncbi:response regulator transcription factor [Streptomyces sp. BK205]|uniref:response regulator transcription factor n=1 Tax=Streptomyces sp. BK205 TaxID=2512164 RepID=UPI00104FFF33|nr:response regulator transcription factor [Streptomyces sp. BK205]TCR21134.1 DNA-binding NarL/FixJ family response regulator [Streptomyces sp. BK205]